MAEKILGVPCPLAVSTPPNWLFTVGLVLTLFSALDWLVAGTNPKRTIAWFCLLTIDTHYLYSHVVTSAEHAHCVLHAEWCNIQQFSPTPFWGFGQWENNVGMCLLLCCADLVFLIPYLPTIPNFPDNWHQFWNPGKLMQICMLMCCIQCPILHMCAHWVL